jgi:hypothetical protein
VELIHPELEPVGIGGAPHEGDIGRGDLLLWRKRQQVKRRRLPLDDRHDVERHPPFVGPVRPGNEVGEAVDPVEAGIGLIGELTVGIEFHRSMAGAYIQ